MTCAESYRARAVPEPAQSGKATRGIDEDATYHLGGDAEEMRPVLPLYRSLIDELQEGFVHQCSRLERVIRTLAPQIAGGELP